METITIKEFLNNPKDYLEMVETTPLVLTGKRNLKFQLTIFEEDDKFEEKYMKEILEGKAQVEKGEVTIFGDGSARDFQKFCEED